MTRSAFADAAALSDGPFGPRVEAAIFELLASRAPQATVCPSEVARALMTEQGNWRALMPEVRRVAQVLAQSGRLSVTQKGQAVDPIQVRGPVRLGRPASRKGS